MNTPTNETNNIRGLRVGADGPVDTTPRARFMQALRACLYEFARADRRETRRRNAERKAGRSS